MSFFTILVFIFFLFPSKTYADSLWIGGKTFFGFITNRYSINNETIYEEQSLWQYSGYTGFFGRYPRNNFEFLTDINIGFSNTNNTNHPFFNQARLGIDLYQNTNFWIGRQLNSAAYLHPSFDSDITDGAGIDNQPFCIFKSGCFTTNLAMKNINPYANRILIEYKPSKDFSSSISFTPLIERENIYQEYSETYLYDQNEISLGFRNNFSLWDENHITFSLGYTYSEIQDSIFQSTIGLAIDPNFLLLSYAKDKKNSFNDRLSLSFSFPLDEDIYFISWLKKGFSKNSTNDFQIGYKSPILAEDLYISLSFQGRILNKNFKIPQELGSMISWSVKF